MSRLLYRLSYPAAVSATSFLVGQRSGQTAYSADARCTGDGVRAPMRNRTADLLLTMETLCLLSYRGA
jgi:hypothetical protein